MPCRAADSTGVKVLGDGEWQTRKHGVQGRRQWRKVNCPGFTGGSEVSMDGAYGTRRQSEPLFT